MGKQYSKTMGSNSSYDYEHPKSIGMKSVCLKFMECDIHLKKKKG